LAAVVGEVGALPLTAGRRLLLAGEAGGVTLVALRRWRSGGEAARQRAAPSRPPASARRSGASSCCAAAAAHLRNGSWRKAMRRVMSLWLPRWPTDRLRAAPDEASPSPRRGEGRGEGESPSSRALPASSDAR